MAEGEKAWAKKQCLIACSYLFLSAICLHLLQTLGVFSNRLGFRLSSSSTILMPFSMVQPLLPPKWWVAYYTGFVCPRRLDLI